MSKSRIISTKHQGRFVILNLSCRHTRKEGLAWWEGYRDSFGRMQVECAQCTGFKKKK
jgi:hypothetical protein